MRRSLAVLVAAATSLVLVAFLVPLALLIRSATADRAVAEATAEAGALAAIIATAERDTVRLLVDQSAATTGHEFTVFYSDGATVGAPAERTSAVQLALRGQSLTAEVDDGRQVLVAVGSATGGTAAVATTVPDEELSRGVARTWAMLATLGVGLVGLGVLVADRLARNIVRPMVDASAVSHRLAAGELDARAQPGGPAEVRAVAHALNHLAARIDRMLRDEREAVADLSHRLRTPLTALRLEAEAITDPIEAQRVGAAADALERAVTDVIRSARAVGGTAGTRVCDAAQVVQERVAFWSVLAEDTQRACSTTLAGEQLPVACSADELTDLVDALLGNVFAHTPDGTAFAVRLTSRYDGGARLVIGDAGAGFEPGHTVGRGTSRASSTGLGLDIVRRVAAASGGTVGFGTSTLGGAEVTVDLGKPSPG